MIKANLKILVFVLFFFSSLSQMASALDSGCSLKGKKLYGKVQVVEAFADFKVQVVNSFPDLKVEKVKAFPDQCGKWEYVTAFPDFKIQYVNAFPDLKIEFVKSFPGLP